MGLIGSIFGILLIVFIAFGIFHVVSEQAPGLVSAVKKSSVSLLERIADSFIGDDVNVTSPNVSANSTANQSK